MIKKEIFRQYDIRGIVETDLQDAALLDLANGFAAYFLEHHAKIVLIGYDNRFSSKHIQEIVTHQLRLHGLSVLDIGCVITPLFYFVATQQNIQAGIMITASHNAGPYNGFKIYSGNSTIYGEEILSIYQTILEKTHPVFTNRPHCSLGTYQKEDWFPRYKDYLLTHVKMGPRPLRIGLDCGNGTASFFAEEILTQAGIQVYPLYCTSDPSFPNHFPDPVKLENCKDLQDLVLREKLDAGIGLDGDGDRIGLIDEKGNPVWGDMILILLSREILQKHPGAKVICEVKCSQLLVQDIQKRGGIPILYKTGHSLIKAKMKESGAICAGEMSGHIFLQDEYFGFDDALYAALRVLRILSHANQPLTSFFADLPPIFSTPEIRVEVTEDTKFQIVSNAREYLTARYESLTIDGVRSNIRDGWGLIRASNTGPYLVMRAEAQTQESLEFIQKELHNAIQYEVNL